MNNIQSEKTNNIIVKLGKGILISLLVTLLVIFIFSILLVYTNISERVIPIVIIIMTFISILIGSIISMRKVSNNGMINGAIIGGTYVMLLYLISSTLNTGFSINVYTIIMIIAGIISGLIGGIIGVNL